ncbi:hypothetical protein [Reichenbachiella sp. MALMAid0571]
MYKEKPSGAKTDRPELSKLLRTYPRRCHDSYLASWIA